MTSSENAPAPVDPGSQQATLLSDLGESGVLARILGPQSASVSVPDVGVEVGPGDDAAVLLHPGHELVVSTDMMVEGRDFRRDLSSPADVGHKAVVQNLADIAAMGGVATALVVSLGAPDDLEADWLVNLSASMREVAGARGVAIVGGDLSGASEIVVSVCVWGHLEGRRAVLRSGARVGDVLAAGGHPDAGTPLGGSAAGLALLFAGRADVDAELVAQHRRPNPDLGLGPRAAIGGATAMIDISDGLAHDAERIAFASGVTIDISSDALARDVERLRAAATALGETPLDWATGGGEEHVMLATFPEGASLPTGFRAIGIVGASSGGDSGRVTLDGAHFVGGGWDHFS